MTTIRSSEPASTSSEARETWNLVADFNVMDNLDAMSYILYTQVEFHASFAETVIFSIESVAFFLMRPHT